MSVYRYTGTLRANSQGTSGQTLTVGAGLSGAVLAERCSKELGMTSIVSDKRDHIGGGACPLVAFPAQPDCLLRSVPV